MSFKILNYFRKVKQADLIEANQEMPNIVIKKYWSESYTEANSHL